MAATRSTCVSDRVAASLAAGSGRSLISRPLGRSVGIGERHSDRVDDRMRPPDQDERDAQQKTDQHITPKRPKPQAEAMHEKVSAEHADVPIAPAEKGSPFAQGL